MLVMSSTTVSSEHRAVRVIHKMQRLASVQEQSKKDNLLVLQKRRKLHLIMLARWMATERDYRDTTQVNTRSQDVGRKKLMVPFPRKERVKRSFLYQASTIWNGLPTELHNTDEPLKFKNRALLYL